MGENKTKGAKAMRGVTQGAQNKGRERRMCEKKGDHEERVKQE